MFTTITLALVSFIFYSSAVEILPNSNNAFISTNLINDPRGINIVNSNNTWKLNQDHNNPLYNWGLVLTLDAAEYSFRDRDGSSISISIDGFCSSSQCDGYFAFSIGDEKYFTFVTDFDGYFSVNAGTGNTPRTGIFIYPQCGASSIKSGNPSELFPDPSSNLNQIAIRNAMSDGDHTQFYQLSSSQNNENFPIKFELINNAKSNSFIFKFSSPTFTTPLECRYNSKVDIHKDFKLYISPDGGNEILKIKKFNVNGETCTTQS